MREYTWNSIKDMTLEYLDGMTPFHSPHDIQDRLQVTANRHEFVSHERDIYGGLTFSYIYDPVNRLLVCHDCKAEIPVSVT